ncbi:MAG TPA: homoserine O-succinyltransferase [Pseudomonadales bacterium]|jgi:homoserine O-succinyltransferase|nr:homoserine O-succinyltransferase [Gammaproteobacteria bacterium]MDP6315439.1 homoserine O-succinyltransferase [Pseudomonadales bacterium]MDP7315104.1 homoserine O-succinyltransferase [Pseudomonadales bacterium]HJL61016.1 homoserine O-succinyltransferase [Pseudomonadales bacterium]|tara:strand:+ start:5110 stop:6060 length:951 start_codon:yes stop_codon:yes gene_type:complete
MPIRIPDNLPASDVLQRENIFCISSSDAEHQDIRPLKILLLNLMPKKIETEIHLLRMLANSPLQVDVELMRINERPSKNTPIEHMETFYKSFNDVRHNKYDGMIITGAPLGQKEFTEVSFWDDMKTIMDWTTTNVTSTMFLCWAVQAAMYHLYDIEKRILKEKISGVYPHHLVKPLSPIVRGFDDVFDAPHSRYAEVPYDDIATLREIEIVAASGIAGVYVAARKDGRQLFITGHSEYEPLCLKGEYERDLSAGLAPAIPENYFPGNDPKQDPIVTWKSHGNLLFSNWLNYYVYQLSPFDMSTIGKKFARIPMQLA